jgi:uncharacterized protein (TIGR00255 family)
MTGFARARRPLGDKEIVVTVKSVNHRGLDIHMHAPSVADPFENAIRSAIKTQVSRGHVDVRLSLPDLNGGATAGLNHAALASYVATFRQAAAQHGLDAQPDLNVALRLPGMLGDVAASELPSETEGLLLDAVREALRELNAFRAREGAEVAQEMLRHNAQVRTSAEEIEQLRGHATSTFQARLQERLVELLRGTQLDPQRLVQEAAILADRSDVGEELARLKIHSNQLGQLLEGGGEVGKKLDFLLQEMNREANTILSKTGGIGEIGLKITDLALAAKAAIEKIREQSLNLE